MSRSAMVISLLLVLALSVVGIALLLSPPTEATARDAAGSLLRLDPSQVRSIRVSDPAELGATVISRTETGGWMIHLERENAQATAPWPGQPTSVRAMVRTLCDLRDASGDAGPSHQTIEPALLVTITLADGSTHAIVFDAVALGGRRIIEVDAQLVGEIDDNVYRALTSPGPAAWRVRSPLASVGERTSRVAIRAPGQGPGIELARLEGRWFLRQPIQSRAADNAATGLIGALGTLTIDRFIDDAETIAVTETGLATPRLTCQIEEDRRTIDPADGQVRTSTRRQTLTIGGPADLSGRLVYASIDTGQTETPTQRQTLVILNIEPIESVALNAEAYLAPFAAQTINQNIGAIAIRIAERPEARFERGIDQWRLLDATGATLGPAPSEPVTALLAALTDTPATSVTIDPPESYRPIASITLFDFRGAPMETIDAGRLDQGQGALVLRSGQVFRVYEGLETPALLAPSGRR